MKEVKRALLDADVNLKVTNTLVDAVKSKAVGMKLVDGELSEQDTTGLIRGLGGRASLRCVCSCRARPW